MAAQSTRNSLICLALSVLFVPGVASAGEPDDLAAPIPVTSPSYKPEVIGQDLTLPPARIGEWVVFTNFDGGDMNWCGWGDNSPHNNCSVIHQGEVLPFSGDAGRRAAVVQVIRNDLKQFNILVTDVRPQSGDYDMEMIGDWNPAPGGGFAGIAPSLDCFNGNGGEVSFTLDYTNSATGIAKAVLQEIAHTWGLEHVESKSDLLYPTTQSVPDPTFVDECFQIVQLNSSNQPVPDNAQCVNQHLQFCSTDKQNSYRELLEIFGPGAPDLTAPTVSITTPAEGAELDPKFDLVFTASDNQTPQLLTISLSVEGPSPAETDPATWPSPAELTFPVSGLAPGEYTITVKAVDEDDNEALDIVHFTVKGEPDPGTTGDPTTGTTDAPTTGPTEAPTTSSTGEPDPSSAGSDSSGSGSGSDATAGLPPATPDGATGGDDGCGCRSDAPSAGAPALLLLLGLARGRRRARR